jgi:hypothetical protein
MLGTILYALLDVSLNTAIWATKTISVGIYNGYNYLMDYDTDLDDTPDNITNKELLQKINEQNESIKSLNKDIIELKQLKIN